MNQTINLKGVRQTAILFASICCTAIAVAIATPARAVEPAPVQIVNTTDAPAPPAPPPPTPGAVAEQPSANPVDAEPEDPVADELKSAELSPGDFLWREDAAKIDGSVRLLVSISDQRAFLYKGDVLVAVSTVSTGRAGHPTPTGTFPITEKRAVHFSNKYNNAPMPHMQRLTNDGIALHAGHIPGRPASHGCVRLPSKFAAALFKVTQRGTPVTITL